MLELSNREIAERLTAAVNLDRTPLCIYGSEILPSEAVSSIEISKCIPKAIFFMAEDDKLNAIYIEKDEKRKCCPGGQAWLGFNEFMPNLHYFLSNGDENYRHGAAEYLISTPELAQQRLNSVGKIEPLGKYIVIRKFDTIQNNKSGDNPEISAFLCFGTAEQIRNLSSLYYFSSETSFEVQFPWGPYCASFVSYPCNMVASSPKNSVILGPTDPTGNKWFPQEYLSMGIPYEIAKTMANDLNSSFLRKGRHSK